MKSRAATPFRASISAGISAVALALAVSTAAAVPASAQGPSVGERSVSAHKKSSPQVFRSVKVSSSRPVVGTEVTVTGRVKGAKRRVVLQVRSGGPWRKVAVTRTRKGKFSFTYDVDSTAPRSLRVLARTAPKVKRSARHLRDGEGSDSTQRTLKSRRVVSRVIRIIVRPAPVVPTPTPDPDVAFAAEVRTGVDAGVRAYRDASNALDPVGANECLSQWADGFAAVMAKANNIVNSESSEWGDDVVSSSEACPGKAPALTQEAVTRVEGATSHEVADKVMQAWKDAWMHEEALRSDFGHDRVLSVGVAKSDDDKWYVVAVFGFNF